MSVDGMMEKVKERLCEVKDNLQDLGELLPDDITILPPLKPRSNLFQFIW